MQVLFTELTVFITSKSPVSTKSEVSTKDAADLAKRNGELKSKKLLLQKANTLFALIRSNCIFSFYISVKIKTKKSYYKTFKAVRKHIHFS